MCVNMLSWRYYCYCCIRFPIPLSVFLISNTINILGKLFLVFEEMGCRCREIEQLTTYPWSLTPSFPWWTRSSTSSLNKDKRKCCYVIENNIICRLFLFLKTHFPAKCQGDIFKWFIPFADWTILTSLLAYTNKTLIKN